MLIPVSFMSSWGVFCVCVLCVFKRRGAGRRVRWNYIGIGVGRDFEGDFRLKIRYLIFREWHSEWLNTGFCFSGWSTIENKLKIASGAREDQSETKTEGETDVVKDSKSIQFINQSVSGKDWDPFESKTRGGIPTMMQRSVDWVFSKLILLQNVREFSRRDRLVTDKTKLSHWSRV